MDANSFPWINPGASLSSGLVSIPFFSHFMNDLFQTEVHRGA